MVMCNSPWGFWKTCVASMDGQQSHGGTICCDTAEDLDFQEEDILKQCEYAKKKKSRMYQKSTQSIMLNLKYVRKCIHSAVKRV